MFSKIDEYSKPILFFPYLLSEKSDSQVSVYKIPLENLNSNFKEFTNQFFNKYNSLYKPGLESPRPEGQRFSLDFWPNHTVAADGDPFCVKQDSNFQNRNADTDPENFDKKQFSFFAFIDSASVGKLHLCRRIGLKSEYIEFIDFNVGLDTDLGFILWSLCSRNPEIKSSIMMRAKFVAGQSKIESIQITVPLPVEAAKIALHLSKVEFD